MPSLPPPEKSRRVVNVTEFSSEEEFVVPPHSSPFHISSHKCVVCLLQEYSLPSGETSVSAVFPLDHSDISDFIQSRRHNGNVLCLTATMIQTLIGHPLLITAVQSRHPNSDLFQRIIINLPSHLCLVRSFPLLFLWNRLVRAGAQTILFKRTVPEQLTSLVTGDLP